MKRVALYIRVSSEKQAKSGDSLREQEDTLNEYVKSQKDMIIHSTYIDDGISGQKLDRDEFQRLMTDVKNNQVDLILFTKLDRWFRSLKHYLNIEDVLQKHNTYWLAVSQPFYDTSTPYGRTFINQVMSFAELEAQMTSERMISIFEHKIKIGEVVSGSTPLGYSIKNKRLIPNEEAKIVQELFIYQSMYANLQKTANYLYDTYQMTRTVTSLRRMFRNTRYIGINRNNTHFCEPIIEKTLFDLVNEQLDAQRSPRKDVSNTYLFSGLIVCGDCLHKMNSGMRGSSRKMPDGTLKRYDKKAVYTCRRAYIEPKCVNTKTINESKLEQYLITNTKELATLQKQQLLETYKPVNHQKIQAKIDVVKNKLHRLKKLYLDEIIQLDEYKEDRTTLEKQLNQLNAQYLTPVDDQLKTLDHLIEKNLFEHYATLDNKEQAVFWRQLIKEISFDNTRKLIITFK